MNAEFNSSGQQMGYLIGRDDFSSGG